MQTLDLVERRWEALLSGEKLDTIRYKETRIAPGLFVYKNSPYTGKYCVVYATNVMDLKLRDVLKYAKDIDYKQNEENLLQQMKLHYPEITLDTVIQYIQHLSPDETKEKYSQDIKYIDYV